MRQEISELLKMNQYDDCISLLRLKIDERINFFREMISESEGLKRIYKDEGKDEERQAKIYAYKEYDIETYSIIISLICLIKEIEGGRGKVYENRNKALETLNEYYVHAEKGTLIEWYYCLGLIYGTFGSTGECGKADELILKYISGCGAESPGQLVILLVGHQKWCKGEYDDALKWFGYAYENDCRDPRIQLCKSILYYKTGKGSDGKLGFERLERYHPELFPIKSEDMFFAKFHNETIEKLLNHLMNRYLEYGFVQREWRKIMGVI